MLKVGHALQAIGSNFNGINVGHCAHLGFPIGSPGITGDLFCGFGSSLGLLFCPKGSHQLKKKGNFVNKIHKTLTPPVPLL